MADIFVAIGDTIKLDCEFKNFAGQYADPTDITLKLYDEKQRQIGITIDIISTYKISTGIYEYPYVVPGGYENITYEYSGILESNPTTKRYTFYPKFVV